MSGELFEQQPRESDKAFRAFKTYRDAGPDRSFRKVAQKLGKSVTQLTRWSQRFNWTERLKAWAKHIEEQERKALDAKMLEKANEWAAREDAQRERRWK